MSLSGGAVVGIIFGVFCGLLLLILMVLLLLKLLLRGPTKGTDNQKKMDGKVVAITGANTGIGKITALELAKRGARVIVLCRNIEKGEETAKNIRDATGATVEALHLDLASLKSVRECAEKLLEKEDKLDILINNAGVMACPYTKTDDGFEMQFGTNHLGHFLLTELLKPLMYKCSASGLHPRIIIVSSIAHAYGRMNWDNLNFEKGGYDKWQSYCQSKLANVLHAKELARRLENSGISVYVLHPGLIKTDLSRHLESWWEKCSMLFVNVVAKTPFYGAQTTLYCALDDSIECESGCYYSDCAQKTPASQALLKDDQKKLWDISEEMVGLK